MYLITGGYDSKAKPAYVSTTEILTEGDSKWKVVGPLPLGIKAAKAVSVENSVFLTGKYVFGLDLDFSCLFHLLVGVVWF